MARYRWMTSDERAHGHEHELAAAADAVDDSDPSSVATGSFMSRRRFVSLALYTGVSVVLTGVFPKVAKADSLQNAAAGLPCAPSESRAHGRPIGGVELIEPEDLRELHIRFRDA